MFVTKIRSTLPIAALLAAGLSVGPLHAAPAQVIGEKISALDGVEIEQKLGVELPREARFTTADGAVVTLGELFDGSLPTILTLNYTDCPQLCSVHLTKLVEAMGKMAPKLALGEQYRIVTISIDARDTPEKAARMKGEYATRLVAAILHELPTSDEAQVEAQVASAWTFLVGDERTIQRVADAIGFGFKWLPERKEFAHDAANIVITPDGRVARYLSGLDPLSGTLRMSLVEASAGEIGTLFDGIFLSCFIYDPLLGSYALAARRVMTAGAVVMVVGLLTGFFFLRRMEARAQAGPAGAEEIVR